MGEQRLLQEIPSKTSRNYSAYIIIKHLMVVAGQVSNTFPMGPISLTLFFDTGFNSAEYQ